MIGFIKKAIGMSGLFRSPKRANELIDEQIFATMKSIGGMFKEDGVMKEIEREIKITSWTRWISKKIWKRWN